MDDHAIAVVVAALFCSRRVPTNKKAHRLGRTSFAVGLGMS